MSDLYCPTCLRDNFKTLKGLTAHVNSVRDCSIGFESHKQRQRKELFSKTDWTRSQRFNPIAQSPTVLNDTQEEIFRATTPIEILDGIQTEDSYGEPEEEVTHLVADWDARDDDAFHFLEDLVEEEEEMVEIGAAGPGPSTREHRTQRFQNRFQAFVLDEQDDTRFEVPHQSAGKVIRMNPSLYEQWRELFQNDNMDVDHPSSSESGSVNPYSPFASELDWRVARWAIKDGIGHKSFDRLLAIPGVCLHLSGNTAFSFVQP